MTKLQQELASYGDELIMGVALKVIRNNEINNIVDATIALNYYFQDYVNGEKSTAMLTNKDVAEDLHINDALAYKKSVAEEFKRMIATGNPAFKSLERALTTVELDIKAIESAIMVYQKAGVYELN